MVVSEGESYVKYKYICVYRPYKESIFKEMNNDNDLNFHLHGPNVWPASLLPVSSKNVERVNILGVVISESGRGLGVVNT